MKPLIIGEAPSRRHAGEWARPMYGPIGKTLCQMANLRTPERDTLTAWHELLVSHFDVRNAVERHEDAYPWGARQDALARIRWVQCLRERTLTRRLVVVCLGRRAAKSVGIVQQWPWCDWMSLGELVYAVAIPHPSGLNRLYNDGAMLRKASCVLQEALSLA